MTTRNHYTAVVIAGDDNYVCLATSRFEEIGRLVGFILLPQLVDNFQADFIWSFSRKHDFAGFQSRSLVYQEQRQNTNARILSYLAREMPV